MSEPRPTEPASRPTRSSWPMTAALAASAVVYQGWNLLIALGRDDTNHLETTLQLILARAVREGPGDLYGPFSAANPLVLIHAPLYYRLAGLLTNLLAKLGLDPLLAAMAGGRTTSALGMLGVLAATWALARCDGAPKRAGLWAALLVAGAPIFGSFPATIRPDVVALAFQTAGVALANRWLEADRRRLVPLLAAFSAFALGQATKQSYVVTPALTSAFLLIAAVRGRARFLPILAGIALMVLIAAGEFGLEQWLTRGQMRLAVYEVSGQLRRIQYAGWAQLRAVAFEVAKESAGLIVLGLAAAVGWSRRQAGRTTDGRLWAYLVVETALAGWLTVNSTGSWVNYAMPPVVYGSALVARGLDRSWAAALGGWRRATLVAAGLLALAVDVRYVAISARNREVEAARLRELFADPAVAAHPPVERYFVARPQYNRLYGRVGLAHDDWLYTAYELAGAAAPRSEWLKAAIASGPIRVVIVAREPHRDPQRVEGTATRLPALGYRKVSNYDLYDVWVRP